jgi:hypothetical protein
MALSRAAARAATPLAPPRWSPRTPLRRSATLPRRARCALPARLARGASLQTAAASESGSAPPAGAFAWGDAEQEALYDTWAEAASPEAEAAVASSLVKLEWPQLCDQVGRFCATALGRQAVLQMRLPDTRAETEARCAWRA